MAANIVVNADNGDEEEHPRSIANRCNVYLILCFQRHSAIVTIGVSLPLTPSIRLVL